MVQSNLPKVMVAPDSTKHSASSPSSSSEHDESDRVPFAISTPLVPVTKVRKSFYPPEDSPLQNLGTARANVAADVQSPNGSTENNYTAARAHQTVLQQHIDYWDPDLDGVIWPTDTYRGCRRFGWNPVLSFFAAAIINLGLSYPTCSNIFPDPLFRIYISRIHKAKHGSDSGSYDNEGRFRPQQFEDIFSKYDRGNKGGLSLGDVWFMLRGYRVIFDVFGWTAMILEWIATYLVIWPADGIMRKEDVRAVYDGSIFYKKAHELEMQRSREVALKRA